MKKVLTAALICAASSFAAWDYFPVIEYGKGEAKINFEQSRQGDDNGGGFGFKTRYSPLANLELTSVYEGDGVGNYVIGARYQVIPVLSGGVDVGFPIGGYLRLQGYGGADVAIWSFTPNVQFSMPLSEALVLGSNAQLSIYTEDSDTKAKPGMDLSAGAEADFTIGKSLIWLSFTLNTGLTSIQIDGKVPKGADGKDIKLKDELRGLELSPALGYLANVGNLSLGTSVALQFGKDAGHENFNTILGIDFSVKF